ncbi:MAG TPA: Plug domain-containing protein [Gemmatimonadaceae bacterium]|nr:Plug domain-containing protein [Gemmatimonadaceae bacterium]
MSLGALRRGVLIGLGAVAGAVLPLRAQQKDTIRVPTPPRADTMIKNDSTILGIVPLPAQPKKDTLKAPLSRADAPPVLDIGPARIYDRAAMFATGSLTLGDLLGRVPGLTAFTTGWIGAPTVVASQGDFRRIRIFLDGLEIDPLDRRSQGTSPVNELPLHALEEVRIERGADEVRVYARSWRVDRTTPYTRADIATGDQNTNLYRAFFGRRYSHGEALQVSAEQFNTQPDRRMPSTGGLHIMGRLGMTHGPWSGDLFAERSDIDRAPWAGIGNPIIATDTIPGWETRRTTAYARVGNGDPERGRWMQLIASVESFRGSPRTPATLFGQTPSETKTVKADSTAYENQYLLTGGASLLGARVSGAERIRAAGGRVSHVASGRASYEVGWLAASLLAEGKSALDPSRVDATVRLEPFGRIALLGSASRRGGGRFSRIYGNFGYSPVYLGANGEPQLLAGADSSLFEVPATYAAYELSPVTSYRAEAGIRVHDLWFIGGVLRRGATTLLPASGMDEDSAYSRSGAARVEGQATATTAAIRGRIYGPLHADAWAVAWSDTTGLYRPRYQTRSELYLQTNLLQRFPRGNFGLLASLAHEYRSSSRFAQADGSIRSVAGFRRLDFKLELRIQTAVVSYQFRNVLQERYAEVPGFIMPRQTQFYGVRWDFWN